MKEPRDNDVGLLLSQAAAGQQEALSSLLDRSVPSLRVFVARRMSRALSRLLTASDIVQSACREALVDLAHVDFRSESRFQGWFRLAARRKLIDKAKFHRRARRDPRRLDPDGHALLNEWAVRTASSSPLDRVVRAERAELLRAALAHLTPAQRHVIQRVKLEGLSHAEAAKQLGKSPAACRQLLVSGLRRLASVLATNSPTASIESSR